jgi:hypothetical protein
VETGDNTITQFRKALFQKSDEALKGNKVQYLYKGVVFRVVPETTPPKLSRLVGQPVVAPGYDPAQGSEELLAEMEAEWTKDWSDL